jgi:hypothetical protein
MRDIWHGSVKTAPPNDAAPLEPNLHHHSLLQKQNVEEDMKGILLWLVGLPIPIIILLYLFHVI